MLEAMTVPYPPTVITEADSPATSGTASTAATGLFSRQPLLLAGLGAATISASAVFVVLSGASPVSTAFYRSAIAMPVLIVLAVLEQRKYGRRPLGLRLRGMVAGVFLAVDLILWTHSIIAVGAGVATVLGNLQVLVVVGISWLIYHERPGRAVLAALPVVMLGVVLVSGLVGKQTAGEHPLAGICYGIGTSVSYAIYLTMLRRASSERPHVAGPVADASAGTAIASLLFGLCFGGLILHPVWPAIGWLTTLALLSQVAGWLLITSSLPRLPAALTSVLLTLQPLGSVALAALILGESPSPLQLVGVALVLAGLLAAGRGIGARRDARARADMGAG